MENKKNKANKNEEILKSLPNAFLYKINEVLKGIELALIFHRAKPYRSDFVSSEYFNRVDFISSLKILGMLDTKFDIINFNIRTDKIYNISLKNEEDTVDFMDFVRLIRKIYKEQDKIRKLTFVDPEEKRFKVIVNEDYSEELIGDSNKLYWKLLSLLAQDKKCYKKEYTSAYDQLNNKDKTPFKDDYEFSPLLQTIDGEILFRDVHSEVITDKEYRKRKDRLEIDL